MSHNILIVAAEASSVPYAKRLMRHWAEKGRDHHYVGVGDREMEKMGFHCLGYAEEMAVVGVSEILEHYQDLKKVFHAILKLVREQKPQFALLMDYPGFNLRLAKELHLLGVPVYYYIAPQIWAWKQSRVEIIKKYCKKVFVLFPFELDFYQAHGVSCEFVGHPILEDLGDAQRDSQLDPSLRLRYGIGFQDRVLGLMPGSRRGEIKRHLLIQLQTAALLKNEVPNLRVLVLQAPTLSEDLLRPYLEEVPIPITLVREEPFRMISMLDFALVASGTATLMVGLLEKPMVIMYRMAFLTSLIARLVVRGYFGLVNRIMGREIVPEIFQSEANPENLARLLLRFERDPEYRRNVISDLKKLRHELGDSGSGGATERVAHFLEAEL